MKGMHWLFLVALPLSTACAVGEYRSTAADRPLTQREIASRELTISGENAEAGMAEAFAQAMTANGFRLVDHPAYHGELEVSLATEQGRQGPIAVATVRSDGFFVDEARAHLDRGEAAAAWLAKTLAISERMAEFVRNSGTPEQTNLAK